MIHGVVDDEKDGAVYGVVCGVANNSVVLENKPIIAESAYFSIAFTWLAGRNIHFTFGFIWDTRTFPTIGRSSWIPNSLYS